MDVSLATAEKFDQPTQVPSSDGALEVDENLRAGNLGTQGQTEFDFRKDNGVIALTSTSTVGSILSVINLNPDLTGLNIFKDRFQYYMFTSIYLVIKCIAPFSTASGSVQVAYNSDPENPFSTNAGTALQQAMELLDSKQISSKGEITVSIDVNKFASAVYGKKRYVKKGATANPRAESFGQLAIIVRGKAADGGSTSWSLTVGGTIRAVGRTFNTTTTTYRTKIDIPPPTSSQVVLTYPPIGKNGLSGTLTFESPGTIPSAGVFILQTPLKLVISAVDDGADDDDNVQDFTTYLHSCKYVCDGSFVTLFFEVFQQEPTVVDLDTSNFTAYYDGPVYGEGLYESVGMVDSVGRSLTSSPEGKSAQTMEFFQSLVESMCISNWQKVRLFKNFTKKSIIK